MMRAGQGWRKRMRSLDVARDDNVDRSLDVARDDSGAVNSPSTPVGMTDTSNSS